MGRQIWKLVKNITFTSWNGSPNYSPTCEMSFAVLHWTRYTGHRVISCQHCWRISLSALPLPGEMMGLSALPLPGEMMGLSVAVHAQLPCITSGPGPIFTSQFLRGYSSIPREAKPFTGNQAWEARSDQWHRGISLCINMLFCHCKLNLLKVLMPENSLELLAVYPCIAHRVREKFSGYVIWVSW